MEEILMYDNRQKLYRFLIDDYGFKIVSENNYGEMGFYVDLASDFFSLRYTNDRNCLDIDIASNYDNKKQLFALSFIKDLIYTPDAINMYQISGDNAERINWLHEFIKKDFVQITELVNEENFYETKKKIDEGLDKTFYLKFPIANNK